ncbi:unnamed protein product [Amaranthus hypochondriacus]
MQSNSTQKKRSTRNSPVTHPLLAASTLQQQLQIIPYLEVAKEQERNGGAADETLLQSGQYATARIRGFVLYWVSGLFGVLN